MKSKLSELLKVNAIEHKKQWLELLPELNERSFAKAFFHLQACRSAEITTALRESVFYGSELVEKMMRDDFKLLESSWYKKLKNISAFADAMNFFSIDFSAPKIERSRIMPSYLMYVDRYGSTRHLQQMVLGHTPTLFELALITSINRNHGLNDNEVAVLTECFLKFMKKTRIK